jgi:hypothetical protein
MVAQVVEVETNKPRFCIGDELLTRRLWSEYTVRMPMKYGLGIRVNSIIAISHLDDTNSVSNIKGIKVLCESNICLLLAIRSNKGVH